MTQFMYELLHTFFVITAQFVAFFAMVFWLFLFLFTFFCIEKQEFFFKKRRALRRKLLRDYWEGNNSEDSTYDEFK
jgi:hypothetical protein